MALSSEIMMEFCRLCQSRLGKTPLQYDEELVKKIAEVTRVKVNDELNNYLPMLVCLSCQDKILDMYNYIQTVQNVDKNLRSMVKKRYFPELDNYCENSDYEQPFQDTFKCEQCSATFSDHSSLQIHKSSHGDEPKTYKCPVCLKVYNRERSYDLHKKIHLELYCSYCSKTFDEKTERNDHTCVERIKCETNTLQKNCKAKLQKTKPKFKIKSGLLKFATFPQEGDTFQCGICDKKFNDKNNLRHHLKVHRSFTCTEENCLKELPSAYSLKIHQLDHLGRRPYLCVTCGKSFRTKSSLSCHEKIHSEIKGYRCDLCNIGFSVRSNLRAHEKKYHEGIRFYCSQCTKEFMSKCSLERHEKIHTGVKEFKCGQCTSAFYTNKELLKHQRYHQGLKQHKCEECFKTFFERHHLIIHLRSHSGERPYACKVPGCGKAFAESQKLKRHHIAKHNAIN
ncbi:zinc finger protein 431-like [Anoplophora glabripennis]|uniref:zinc finger protein 431-like n=1 Tax=Anoplophora glabripennis TaxID=217634 RepID=UPI000874F49F|nr:zinc finger protein 431-like [Anoplophora glabripennis]